MQIIFINNGFSLFAKYAPAAMPDISLGINAMSIENSFAIVISFPNEAYTKWKYSAYCRVPHNPQR